MSTRHQEAMQPGLTETSSDEPVERAMQHAAETQTGAATDEHALIVLIADDEVPIADIVAEVIADMGHPTHVAANGRHALEMARAQWPALVVTDLMMPELDGAGLIAALREEGAGRPPVPVILMTAAGSLHSKAAGADAVLPKPFDLATLEALVARFLSAGKERE